MSTRNHGGARPGAGRKPKVMLYADEAQALERKIMDALPAIIDKLIEQAKAGDIRAAKYLVDRILGRVARLPAPPAEDQRLPYGEEELETDSGFRDHTIAMKRNDIARWSQPREPLRINGMTLDEFIARETGKRPPGH